MWFLGVVYLGFHCPPQNVGTDFLRLILKIKFVSLFFGALIYAPYFVMIWALNVCF